MSRCTWLEYIYKLMLAMLGVSMVTPGMGRASSVPHSDFNWTRENERFQADGGARLSIPIDTNLVIRCPYLTSPPEYYRIYWVSEQGYKGCFRPHNDSKLLVDCNTPNNFTEWVQEFRKFTGVPGQKDFVVGKNYYLATFSTGTQHGLQNEIGGACQDYKLKLNLTVVDGIKPTTPKSTSKPVSTTKKPGTVTPTPTTRTTRQTSTTSTTTQSTTISQTSFRPHPTDIPDITDIPVISVPDTPGGNTGVIDISSAQTLRVSSALVLSLCLSLLHILYLNLPYIQR